MNWAKPNRYRVQERGRTKQKRRCRHFNRAKKLHDDQHLAAAAGQQMADQYQQVFSSWRCDHCRHWHVGRPGPDDYDKSGVTIHYPATEEAPNCTDPLTETCND